MFGSLSHQLAMSTVLVAATVVIHLIGLDLLMRLTGLHLQRFRSAWVHLDRLVVPLGIVLGLFALHGLEIWLYALTYWGLDILPTVEESLYVSTSAYSTVGEAGAVLPRDWRIVSVLESVNGMLLIGWSTAFLFQVLSRLMDPDDDDHVLPKGAISRKARRPASADPEP